jgi:hypothetical protein
MSDISIQFHAVPEELLQFLDECVRQFALRIVAIRLNPFIAFELEPERLQQVLTDPSIRRLSLSTGSPSLPAASGNAFEDENPDNLLVDIGRRTEKGLSESWIACRTSSPRHLAVWKQIEKRLKTMTHIGATAINPKTGACARLARHRFTDGAIKAQLQGVPMLPAAGTARLKLGN